jgi:L,D-peptidoglycan transpeptidase YkuD (ErfK/YbiS/YcfS/YnhG family)
MSSHSKRPKQRALPSLRVRAGSGSRTRGWLIGGSRQLPVALGRAGIVANKREGDGGTPRGVFRPVRVWWRADRGARPRTRLPVSRITQQDAWCEDRTDRRYNRPIRVAPGLAGDRLWRDDALYDLILEIDHNTRPRTAGRGSAVFLHVARRGFASTAGCIAFRANELRRLLERLSPKTRIIVH